MGAKISLDKVIVYYGDDYFPEEKIGFNAFHDILARWLNFIYSPEDLNKDETFHVNMNI